MAFSTISEENGDNGGRTALSRIVIEAERLGDPGTKLCLRVDTQLIATNLTTTQMKFLICELLDRLNVEEDTKSAAPQLH